MPTETTNPTMLDLWATSLDARTAIEDFIDWLISAGHTQPRFHSGQEAALDAYFGINRAQLDRERRDLLAEAQRSAAAITIDPDGSRP